VPEQRASITRPERPVTATGGAVHEPDNVIAGADPAGGGHSSTMPEELAAIPHESGMEVVGALPQGQERLAFAKESQSR
jgi:hypothetical protein